MPEVVDADDIGDWQEHNLSTRRAVKSIAENILNHQFTHYSLDISVATIELKLLPGKVSDNSDLKFVPTSQLMEYGLPTPVRKILSA